MAAPLLLVYMLGIGIRAWLFRSSFLEWLEENNEISTPITAWKRSKSTNYLALAHFLMENAMPFTLLALNDHYSLSIDMTLGLGHIIYL